jgi:uncharacterized protein YgiB involved in biofilm formation
MPLLNKVSVAIAAVLVLTACSASSDMALAERAVEKFHQQMNTQQFEAIYEEATEEFQKSDPKEQTINFLRIVTTKLGDVRSAKKAHWNVTFGFGQTGVTLVYETQFKEEVAREEFVYRVKDSEAKLLTYNVQAKALVTK